MYLQWGPLGPTNFNSRTKSKCAGNVSKATIGGVLSCRVKGIGADGDVFTDVISGGNSNGGDGAGNAGGIS